jgi:hypothetical protein|tara:strand:+ start:5893 stop:6537 length:645 start_codon:yes stop_codon:yes gene_type:complete
MFTNPFTIFKPFEANLSVTLYTKEDNITSDDQIGDNVASLWQVHGNKIIEVDSPTSRTEQADGLVTNKKNLILSIRMADCQPILAYDPESNTVGLVHVGWRGLVAGAIPELFKVMDPLKSYVCIGPSLCQKCAIFSDPNNELPNVDPKFFDENNCVDLMGAADKQLVDLGVSADRIERMTDCTSCNPDKYWAYRGGDRDAVKDGHTNVLSCYLK